MHLVLDAAEDAAHTKWLRETPGAYEWWYYDALSDCGEWAIACIWFLGNPFSPYYRLAVQGIAADPLTHNALFFALYREGKLQSYHFTRFPRQEVEASAALPGEVRLGPNILRLGTDGDSELSLSDENGNGRSLVATLRFESSPLDSQPTIAARPGETHFWIPTAPSCHVIGKIRVQGAQNVAATELLFTGRGYHDHNWGQLPLDTTVQEWYWARAALEGDRAVILYHVRARNPIEEASHLLIFDSGRLILHDSSAQVKISRRVLNGFGAIYATRLSARSGGYEVRFDLGKRLDSAPFYLRMLCQASVTENGVTEWGHGIGEFFRPRMLSWPLTASATKARIVTR